MTDWLRRWWGALLPAVGAVALVATWAQKLPGILVVVVAIPAIAIASIWLPGPLTLGLGSTQIVLLVLTVLVGILTVMPGRVTRLQGVLHLAVLAAFVFLAINP